MVFGGHVVRASPEVVFPTVAPIGTNLMRIILGLEVRVGLVLLTGLHVARVEAVHQIHLDHDRLTVFLLDLIDVHLLVTYEVITLLDELSIGRVFPLLLQAYFRVVAFARRSHLVVLLQIRLVCDQFLRNARLVSLIRLEIVVLLLILYLLLPVFLMVLAIGYEVLHFIAVARWLPALSVHVVPVTVLLHVPRSECVAVEAVCLLSGRELLDEVCALFTCHAGA